MSTGVRRPRFRYFADPVCVGALLVYLTNRWILKPTGLAGWFGRDYVNDLLCLPLVVPVILYVQSTLGIRPRDRLPTWWEVLHNAVVFAVVYEVVLPRSAAFRTVADAWDVVAYLAGGSAAYVLWRWRYGVAVGDGGDGG